MAHYGKDMFDREHNPSHSTLYADVLKIHKYNNCCEIFFFKDAIFYYLQIHFWLLCGLDVLAAGPTIIIIFFSKHLDTMSNVTDCDSSQTET